MGDGVVLVVDPVDAGTADDLGGDDADLFQIAQGLLYGAEAVTLAHKCVHTPPGQRLAGAQQRGKHRASRSGHQAAEGLTKIHMNRIVFI
ncbi:MAG: hypothetical protein QM638_04635 [Nocardioides sp.]|uniref:hypothetical protein n=1 Tax=Nocardioides sp. TaxID=35761 RepID=UPI0039E2D1E6